MKAITVYQPWATLIAHRHKPFEFRGWDYATRYHSIQGGRIAVHSSARPVKHKEIFDLVQRMSRSRLREDSDNGGTGLKPSARDFLVQILQGMEGRGPEVLMPLSAIVATATLGKAVRADTLFKGATNDSDRDDHALFAWPMLDVTAFPGIACKGAQGFWNVPSDIEWDIQQAERLVARRP